ncbi:hypothetical protein WDZ11_00140 (plasmid) [Roseomonas mucosa]|uniref:hypothetical protein n=1 Tax=Roseomonas mucosa TaxID=207340 RepID=UPI0030D27ECE
MGEYTQAEYDALRAAYARGVTKLTYSTGPGQTKSVEFASTADLERRMRVVAQALGLMPVAPLFVFVSFNRNR